MQIAVDSVQFEVDTVQFEVDSVSIVQCVHFLTLTQIQARRTRAGSLTILPICSDALSKTQHKYSVS